VNRALTQNDNPRRLFAAAVLLAIGLLFAARAWSQDAAGAAVGAQVPIDHVRPAPPVAPAMPQLPDITGLVRKAEAVCDQARDTLHWIGSAEMFVTFGLGVLAGIVGVLLLTAVVRQGRRPTDRE
jgi:hypothetical protein